MWHRLTLWWGSRGAFAERWCRLYSEVHIIYIVCGALSVTVVVVWALGESCCDSNAFLPPPRWCARLAHKWEAEKAERMRLQKRKKEQRERERERRTELLAASSYSHQSSDRSMPLNGVSLSSPSAMKSPFKNQTTKQTSQPPPQQSVCKQPEWPLVCMYIVYPGVPLFRLKAPTFHND